MAKRHYVFPNRILFATRYTRHLDKHGFLRFSNWKLYAERSLAHQLVSVWVYEGTFKIEYQAVTLSKYAVKLQEDHKHVREVSPDEWVLYWRMPPSTKYHRRQIQGAKQLPLFVDLPPVEKAVGAEGNPHLQQGHSVLQLVSKTSPHEPK